MTEERKAAIRGVWKRGGDCSEGWSVLERGGTWNVAIYPPMSLMDVVLEASVPETVAINHAAFRREFIEYRYDPFSPPRVEERVVCEGVVVWGPFPVDPR